MERIIVTIKDLKTQREITFYNTLGPVIPGIGDTIHIPGDGIQHVVKERHFFLQGRQVDLWIDFGYKERNEEV